MKTEPNAELLASINSLRLRRAQAAVVVSRCDGELDDLERGMNKYCEEFSAIAMSETPELASRIEEAYIIGDSIVNRMMAAGRYPRSPNSICRYVDTLKTIDTPEARIAYAAWVRWDTDMQEWNRLHPVPDCFHWNGTHLEYARGLR